MLNRLSTKVEPILITQQAGLRPNKNCTSQVVNLFQYNEDGFDRGNITGVASVDLSAAYGMIQHNILQRTLVEQTIRSLLQNRTFHVEFQISRNP